MLRLVFEIDTLDVTGVKECLAMHLEEFGDLRLVQYGFAEETQLSGGVEK